MNDARRSLLLAGVAALGCAALPGRAWADAPATIRDVSLAPTDQAVRVTVSLERAGEYRTMFLSNPDRFVIDIANARWSLPQGAGAGASMISRYRYAQREGGAARLVLDLSGPARLLRQEVVRSPAPALVFDLAATDIAAAPVRRELNRQRVIVIDAGHGGRDPGAIGATGVREKDVVLHAALQLREALGASGRYRVELTRDSDRFVELQERVRFARAQHADLFISLHADSHSNRDAHGAAIYTLSERGASRAQTIMAAQDWELDLGQAPRDAAVGDILVDLAQRETTNRSAQFAQTLIPRIGAVSPLLTNSHRNAGFFVLLAPDVPAVLVETGFLSNVADERRLSDPRASQAMAQAMAGAVDTYFAGSQLYAARA
jgi:N-acetylmuramoyl-L-alanine amidase